MPDLPSAPRNQLPARPALSSIDLAADSGGAPDWRRHATAVWRYRWWILGLTVLGTIGGAGASRVLPPRYLVQATIWIQSSEARGTPDRGPIGANQLLAPTAWGDLLKSYVVLDAVARERRLYLQARPRDVPALAGFAVGDQFTPGRYRLSVDHDGQTFRLQSEDGTELEQGAVGSPVGRTLGFIWTPTTAVLTPGREVRFVVSPLRDAAKKLADNLNVTLDLSGNFLRVALTSPNGTDAAATVNAVADRYVAVATDLKRVKVTELSRLLNEQLQAAEANLHKAERALEDFRVRTIMLPAEPVAGSAARTSPVSEFLTRRVQEDQLRRDQDALAQVLAQGPDSLGFSERLAAIGAVQGSADLTRALTELTTKRAERRALLYRYTDDHPAVQRVTTDLEQLEHQTIPGLIRGLVAELATQRRALASQLETGGRELQGIPQRAIEDARLRRDVSIAENLFTSVQQRYSEARLAEASSIADVRVLDAAVAPETPVKNTAARLLILGLFAGLGLGVVGAVVVDRFDPRVRYPAQVTTDMGLRILGALPHVKKRAGASDDESGALVIETMRGVRLSLIHAYGTAGPLVVTITSPAPGDGKSFVSANLALACAQAGQRTLLIDGDTRRGALHRVLGGVRRPGLTDFLAGNVSFEALIQTPNFGSLQFIGAGSRIRESPELLGSPRMVELLVRLRAMYPVIIVDSPPLGAGVDPYTLGTMTGAMMLVLRTGATNLDLARTKVAMLENLPIRVLGAVLNDVRLGQMYGEYYGYMAGYGTTTEDGGTRIARRRLQGAL